MIDSPTGSFARECDSSCGNGNENENDVTRRRFEGVTNSFAISNSLFAIFRGGGYTLGLRGDKPMRCELPVCTIEQWAAE